MAGGTRRMTTKQESKIPDNWQGSEATWLVYESLVKHGKRPGVDFSYQPRNRGRRMDMDTSTDFVLPPDLALQVQEAYYEHPSGIETRGTDMIAKAQLAGIGITMILLNHSMLKQDPDWLVSEALQYRDHSME